MSLNVAKRFNSGKPRLFFNSLGREAQIAEAAVWQGGAEKYAERDKEGNITQLSVGGWIKGTSWTEAADSVRRHLDAFLSGEEIDPESGQPHAAHLVTSSKILLQSFLTRKDLDDRGIDKSATPTEEPKYLCRTIP